MEILYKTAQKMPDVNESSILGDVANFVAKEGPFQKSFLWNSDTIEAISSIAWWRGLCSNTELSRLAVRFLELPATSAACERSFSSYSRIHTKNRNRLTNTRASKIVFVAHNLKLMAEPHTKKVCKLTSEAEPTAGPSSNTNTAEDEDCNSDSDSSVSLDYDMDTDSEYSESAMSAELSN